MKLPTLFLPCTLALIFALVAHVEADLVKIGQTHNSRRSVHPVCAQNDQPGDSRCKKLSSSFSTQGSNTPKCGCQTCPDLKTYDNSVTNYCKAQPTDGCSTKPKVKCLLVCTEDTRCKTLDYDHSQVSCGCPCQKCPDENYYSGTNNYTSPDATPLDAHGQSQCPNVLHPVPQAQDLCS